MIELHLNIATVLITIVVLLCFIYAYYIYIYTYWKRKGVPYIKPIVPFGNALPLALGQLSIGEHGALMYKQLKKLNKRFGGYFVFHFPIFQPIDPELIKNIMTKDFQYFQGRGFYYDIDLDPLSAHLVSLSGEKWKKLRSKVSPSFTSVKLKLMFETLLECNKELGNVLDEPSKKQEPIDIIDILSRLVTDNIGTCAYGVECKSLLNPNAELYQYGKLVIKSIFDSLIWNFFAISFPSVMRFFKIPITNKKSREYLLGFLKEIVEHRQKNNIQRNDFLDYFINLKKNNVEIKQNCNKMLQKNENCGSAYQQILKEKVLNRHNSKNHYNDNISIGKHLNHTISTNKASTNEDANSSNNTYNSKEDINNSCNSNETSEKADDNSVTFNEFAALAYTFYIAGYVSTFITMAYCLFELSLNQVIQKQVREEIFCVLKKHRFQMTYEAIMEMHYLDKVISEVLRKYPPTPVIIRECQKEYKIPDSEVTIDKGTACWIFILGIHMDPEYFPNPEKFDPERFSEQNKEKRHPFTYLPFGEGPRNCVGKRFAMLQIKLGLVKLLQNYIFTLDSKTKVPIDFYHNTILLVPKDKIWLQATRIVQDLE